MYVLQKKYLQKQHLSEIIILAEVHIFTDHVCNVFRPICLSVHKEGWGTLTR